MPMRNRIDAKDASANHESGRMAPLPTWHPLPLIPFAFQKIEKKNNSRQKQKKGKENSYISCDSFFFISFLTLLLKKFWIRAFINLWFTYAWLCGILAFSRIKVKRKLNNPYISKSMEEIKGKRKH